MTRDARAVGDRIEQLLAGLRAGRDRETAEELIRLTVELYGAGLERIVALLSKQDPTLITTLADDDLVASLLLVHDLHPLDVDTRVQRALDRVRPYLGSHAGGVTYLGIDADGMARLRLEGSCDGCPSSTQTVRMAIEGALADAAPELAGVAVDGVTEPGLLQVGMGPPPGWIAADATRGAASGSGVGGDATRGAASGSGMAGDVGSDVAGGAAGHAGGGAARDVGGEAADYVAGDVGGGTAGHVAGGVAGNVGGDATRGAASGAADEVGGDAAGGVAGGVASGAAGGMAGGVAGGLAGGGAGGVVADRTEWVPLPEAGPPTGRATRVDVAGIAIMVCSVRGTRYAYRDACPTCDASLNGSTVDGPTLTCPTCDARFDVRLAGRGLDGTTGHLDPLPLLSDSHGTRVAVPAATVPS